MKISRNRKSFFFISLVFFMVAVLLLNVPVSSVHAAENNPEGNTISFPKIDNPDDNCMDTNNGTISTLLATGTVKINNGTIETSNGTVTENRGIIKKLLSGNVGTNYGTIDEINGTGTLGENDALGTVTLNNGNTITRNDGKIVNNYGTVLKNYHEIENNYGNVTMYIDSSVTNNDSRGVVTFKGNGTVESNNGTIVIDGASVTVTNNTGTIKLLDNATLKCTNNYGSIVKENDAATYKCTCVNNYGTIGFSNNSDGSWPYVSQYYKIVFAGDDGKAEITLCEASDARNKYTMKGSVVEFILPDEYVCNSGKNLGDCGTEGKSKWFALTDNVDEERKEFTIVCHLCSAGSYSYDADKHWQSCSECGRQLSESAHSFGDYVSNNDATCMIDGTKTRVCTICRYAETVADEGSHLTSNYHNVVTDYAVAATETQTGLTEGSHCADCGKVFVAQEIIPVKESKSSGTVVLDPRDSQSKETENTPISDGIKTDATKTDDVPVPNDVVASDNRSAPNDKSDILPETGDDASNTDEAVNGKESEKKTTNVVPIVVVSASVVVIGSLATVWGLKRRKRF